MERITEKNLNGLMERINTAAGTPLAPWQRNAEGKLKAAIGNYHLEFAYGGCKIVQTVSEGGGITSITHGYQTKRQVWDMGQAFLRGLESANTNKAA